jgi:hypothetical protein
LRLRQHPADALKRVAITVTSDEQDRDVAGVMQPLGGLGSFAAFFEIEIHQYEIGLPTRCEFDSFSGIRGESAHIEA